MKKVLSVKMTGIYSSADLSDSSNYTNEVLLMKIFVGRMRTRVSK